MLGLREMGILANGICWNKSKVLEFKERGREVCVCDLFRALWEV